MYIADEILKFLVCELCFEQYNLKDRLPYALFPCGHTFCEICVKSLPNRQCAACSVAYEESVKNWALINLIPRERILDDYEKMVDEFKQGVESLENLKKLNADRHELNKDVFDAIRSQINARAAYLIEKINEGKEILLSSVNQIEEKWTRETQVELDYERALINIMNEFNSRIDSEEVKTDETTFIDFRNLLHANLESLNRRLEGKNPEEYVNFKVSEVDLEAAFDIENLFGELFVNEGTFGADSDRDNASIAEREKQVKESLSKIEGHYSEIFDHTNMVSVRPVGQREPMTSSSKNQTNYYKPNENKFLIPPRYPYPEEQKPADKSTTKNIIIIPVTDDKLNKLVKKSKFNLKSESPQYSDFQPQQQLHQSADNNQVGAAIVAATAPKSRHCRLTRSNKNEFYGFDLKTMKADGTHIVGTIQPDSPAYRAGLMENDIILEVNGDRIDASVDRDKLIAKIMKHSKHVDMLVLSSSSDTFSNNPTMATTSDKKLRAQSMNQPSEFSTAPNTAESHIITLTRSAGQSYGFSISESPNGPPYISEIHSNSPASNSMLKAGDFLLKMNGVDLAGKSYAKILEIAKKQTDKGTKIDLEIVDASKSAKTRTASFSDMTGTGGFEGTKT